MIWEKNEVLCFAPKIPTLASLYRNAWHTSLHSIRGDAGIDFLPGRPARGGWFALAETAPSNKQQASGCIQISKARR